MMIMHRDKYLSPSQKQYSKCELFQEDIRVTVLTVGGVAVRMNVEPQCSLLQMQHQIFERLQIPPVCQKLIIDSEILDCSGACIEDHCGHDGSVSVLLIVSKDEFWNMGIPHSLFCDDDRRKRKWMVDFLAHALYFLDDWVLADGWADEDHFLIHIPREPLLRRPHVRLWHRPLFIDDWGLLPPYRDPFPVHRMFIPEHRPFPQHHALAWRPETLKWDFLNVNSFAWQYQSNFVPLLPHIDFPRRYRVFKGCVYAIYERGVAAWKMSGRQHCQVWGSSRELQRRQTRKELMRAVFAMRELRGGRSGQAQRKLWHAFLDTGRHGTSTQSTTFARLNPFLKSMTVLFVLILFG